MGVGIVLISLIGLFVGAVQAKTGGLDVQGTVAIIGLLLGTTIGGSTLILKKAIEDSK